MQLGKLDGDLQSSIRVVRVVHHAIHTEILGGVGDVGHAAPTAGHQIGHDFHRQRMGLISNEGLDYRNLVFDWARRVGEGTFKLDVVVERVGDREQFVPDTPCVLAAVTQLGGQRVTRNAVCDTRCFSSHWSPPFLEGFDHFLSLSSVGDHLVDHRRLHVVALQLAAQDLAGQCRCQHADLTLQAHQSLLLLGFDGTLGGGGDLRRISLRHGYVRRR